jgi:hypothetical protein
MDKKLGMVSSERNNKHGFRYSPINMYIEENVRIQLGVILLVLHPRASVLLIFSLSNRLEQVC